MEATVAQYEGIISRDLKRLSHVYIDELGERDMDGYEFGCFPANVQRYIFKRLNEMVGKN